MSLSTLSYSVSYFLSGLIFTISLIAIYFNWDIHKIVCVLITYQSIFVTIGIIIIALSVFIGLIFDSIRELVFERIYDQVLAKINKDYKTDFNFFFSKDNEYKITELTEDYYNYYVLDLNLAISLFFVFIVNLIRCHNIQNCHIFIFTSILFIFSSILFFLESFLLRKKIGCITNSVKLE